MDDRLVLALDGSTGVCSAALLRLRDKAAAPGSSWRELAPVKPEGGQGDPWEILACRSEADGRAQARTLLRLVDEMLEEVGRRLEELGAVVVGKGPGTFTGVRITVATARALSLSLAVPVVGVSTLSALVAGAIENSRESSPPTSQNAGPSASRCVAGLIVPVVDARRGQLFYGLYRSTVAEARLETNLWRRSGEIAVCDRGALGDLVVGPSAVIVGEEALRPKEVSPGVIFLSRDVNAQDLVVGQDRLEEPGRLPEGTRLTGWLRARVSTDDAIASGQPASGATGRHRSLGPLGSFDPPGAAGTPESVTPIYVRSPDADVHITRMRDPWADGSSGG